MLRGEEPTSISARVGVYAQMLKAGVSEAVGVGLEGRELDSFCLD